MISHEDQLIIFMAIELGDPAESTISQKGGSKVQGSDLSWATKSPEFWASLVLA